MNKAKMTHEQKISYMKIATGVAGYGFDKKTLDMIVSLYDLVIEKQGDTSLGDVSKVESGVKSREDFRRQQEVLGKITESKKSSGNG